MGTWRTTRWGAFALPALVLLVGFPASVAAYFIVQNSVNRLSQYQFDREASAANSLFEIRLNSYSQVLYALRAQFTSEVLVDRVRFHQFVTSLDVQNRYPGFVMLNYAEYVPGYRKQRFEAMTRAELDIDGKTFPDFSIKPPGERDEYFVIVYAEPASQTESALGVDMAANPMNEDSEKVVASLHKGRDTGELTASAQLFRGRSPANRQFLAMRLAVYVAGAPLDTVELRRKAYLGSVGAAFDVDALFASALGGDLFKHVRCKLYDMGITSGNVTQSRSEVRRLLYDTGVRTDASAGAASDAGEGTRLTYRERVSIADRLWEFEYTAPRSTILTGPDKALAPLVLGGGLVTTLLLFAIAYVLATSRLRAVAMADDITRDLRDSETGLADAQRIAHLGNWALDANDWTMTWSAETYRILAMQPGSATPDYASFLQRIHAEDRAAVDAAIRRALASRQDATIEHRLAAEAGGIRWVQTMVKPASCNRLGQILGIIMDVTERKRVEADLTASHEQLQALSRRLVDIQESERRQFSAELHDMVGQNLTALSINLKIVQTQLAAQNDTTVDARLSDSAQLLRETTDAIENVMSELRPQMLDDYGLLHALKWYAGQFAERTGIAVSVAGDEDLQRLTPAAEIALFRITQEALNNVAKHAQASRVEIRVEPAGGQCVMRISDNGKGLVAEAKTPARRRSGMGMVIMRERMQSIGGTIAIDSTAGGGTHVECRVPF